MSIQQTLERVLQQVRAGLHPSDLADLVDELNDQQKQELFLLLSDAEAAAIIQEMEGFDQAAVLRLLTRHRASAILKEMAADDAADLVGELLPEEARELLNLIEEKEAQNIKELLRYPEDTAGGLMTTDFIALPEDLTIKQAFDRLRQLAPRAEVAYYVYVVDQSGRLTGVLSLRDLIATGDDVRLVEVMRRNPITVPVEMNQEEVAGLVSRYDLLALPVVQADGRLLGVVTVDDVLDVMTEEATEDILHLGRAGSVEITNILSMPFTALVRRRLPWLLISVVGGTLSGGVISAYESVLQAVITLAVFIPVIMDMGGAVGTQSSTIVVRALSTGHLAPRDMGRYLFHELKVGSALGLSAGLLAGGVAALWKGELRLGIIVGSSALCALTLAAMVGATIPIAWRSLKVDPAVAASPFVTAIKDITGLLIYFGFASLLLDQV